MTADPSAVWQQGAYDFDSLKRWYRVISSSADRIIAVSEVARRTLLERAAFDEKKIRVIYCGVDESFVPVQDSPARGRVLESHGLSGKEYILYVGSAEPNKNVSGLISAFEELRKQPRYRDLYLVLVGNRDNNYLNILKQVSGREVAQRLISTGYVSHAELPAIYSAARVFVLPTFDEWFGIPLIEAMACGVPVVASSGGAGKEVAADAAVLFDPRRPQEMADAIVSVLNDSATADSLREKGSLRSRVFSWRKTAEQTLAVYREVI
jgi:glycosyltransferase involved in cell wall biosynthesis